MSLLLFSSALPSQALQVSGLWPLFPGSAGLLFASLLEISSLMPKWLLVAFCSPGYGLPPGQHHQYLAGVGKHKEEMVQSSTTGN